MSADLIFDAVGFALIAVILWSYWHERRVTKAQPAAGEVVDTSTAKIHMIARGERSERPTIVMIHGSTTNALDMDMHMAERFSDDRRVLIPDRPGHGYSERPDDGWRLDRQVAALREAVRSDETSPVILFGQSYGGAVALRYALDYPDDVAGLVLLAPVTHRWPGGVAWYNRVAINPVYGWLFRRTFIALYGRFGASRGVAKALRGSAYANRYHAQTRVPLTFRPRWFRNNAEDIVRLYEQLFANDQRYSEISVPTEIVAGSHDMTVITSVHARGLEDQLQSAHLSVVPGAGHALHHSHPNECAEALHRLDERLASAARSPLEGALHRLGSVLPRSTGS